MMRTENYITSICKENQLIQSVDPACEGRTEPWTYL